MIDITQPTQATPPVIDPVTPVMPPTPAPVAPITPPPVEPAQVVAPTMTAPAPTPAPAPVAPNVVAEKQIGKYKVQVINDKCISAGSCVAIAPKVFQLNEQNIAYIVSQDGEDDNTKLLAAQSCPTAAIIVTDTTTGEQVWPK